MTASTQSTAGKKPTSVLGMRTAQKRFLRLVEEHRLTAFLARRQFGKTTTFSAIALMKMMKKRDHTVIFGSAKLNLAREIVRKEAAIMQKAMTALREKAGGADRLQVIDGASGRRPDALTVDDFAGLFEAQRLEFRYYHSNTSYSRTKVVALLPDTVGETGDLMMDEVGRVKNFREVWEAVEPIVQSNPEFRLCISTTPPPDDTHFSFDMLAWPVGTEFPVNPKGNLYRSEMGVMVLRLDAFDAYADGVPVYDLETSKPLEPAEHRRRAHDKDAWDRNYGVKFVLGGTSAVGLMQLDTAQQRGVKECELFVIDDDTDMDKACAFVREKLGAGRVGGGWDVATTEKGTSNPSAFAIGEESGLDLIVRAIVIWKTKDPDIAEDYACRLVDAVSARKEGGRMVKLCMDGTNERYFASMMKRRLASRVPVEIVVGSETIERPGYERMTMKQFLGGRLVSKIDDNHVTLPAQRYVREDFRLVKKERGLFICEPDQDGKHGDTFDGSKLCDWALVNNASYFTPRASQSRVSRIVRARRSREVMAA